MTRSLTPTHRLRRRFTLVAVTAAAALVPTSSAHAEWFFTKTGAQKVARHFVSKHYANTYASDLVTLCRPQGRRAADPRFKYHKWVCAWYDTSDRTSGTVLIVGVDRPGAYMGKVLRGARR